VRGLSVSPGDRLSAAPTVRFDLSPQRSSYEDRARGAAERLINVRINPKNSQFGALPKALFPVGWACMVIHLTGPDTFRSHQRLSQLRDAWRTKHDPKGMGVVSFDAESVTPEEFRSALMTSGFFSQKKLIVLNNYRPSAAGIKSDELVELLKPLSKEDSVVIIIREIPDKAISRASAEKTRGRRTKSAALKITGAKLEDFPLLTGAALEKWVNQEIKKLNGQFTPAGLTALVAATGDDPWRLAMELEKLVLYASGQPITAAMVNDQVPSPFRSNIFALTDAIGLRQRDRALRAMHQELAAGTHPLALLATVATHIRNLIRVKLASEQQITPATMAKQLGLHPYVVQKAQSQARYFTIDQLTDLHHRLIDLNVDIKISPVSPESLLDLFIVDS